MLPVLSSVQFSSVLFLRSLYSKCSSVQSRLFYFSSIIIFKVQSRLRLMLVGIWFGLHWVFGLDFIGYYFILLRSLYSKFSSVWPHQSSVPRILFFLRPFHSKFSPLIIFFLRPLHSKFSPAFLRVSMHLGLTFQL